MINNINIESIRTEFAECQHLNLKALVAMLDHIQIYLGDSRRICQISDGFNSYSIQPMDVS